MNKNKRAFSLIELSIVLIIVSFLITVIINSNGILDAARINSARNVTKNSIVHEIQGLNLWLDATSKYAFNDIAIEEGLAISQWNDTKKSHITPYNATQTTQNLQPSYKKHAVKKLPGIYFDGSNSLSIANFASNGYMTIFVVGQFDNSLFFIEHSSNANSNPGFSFYGQGSRPTAINRSSNLSQNSTNSNWFTEAPSIGTMRYSGGNNISYKLNNNDFIATVDTTSAVTNSLTIDQLNIGSRNSTSLFSTGSFGEIIIYNRSLTDEEVDSVITYLISKWNISNS
jgi:prepilin-type N-terminal cleavage/methylation domain-containing protein